VSLLRRALASVLVLCACPSGQAPVETKPSSPTAPQGPAPAAKPTVAPEQVEAKAVEGTAKALAKVDRAALLSRRTALREGLGEGRRLVMAGDYEAGMARYRALLEVDSHFAPALGELGWAAFKAGDLTTAFSTTQRALKAASSDTKRGMFHYNLGRIAEEREQRGAAIEEYRTSLALRPNATVRKRLQLVLSDGEDPAAGGRGLRRVASGLADREALCASAAGSSLCGEGLCELVARPDPDAPAAMLHVGDVPLSCWHPVVRSASGWSLFSDTLLAQAGSEVEQGVDALEGRILSVAEAGDAGPLVAFAFEDHLQERNWDSIDLEDEDAEEMYPQDDSYTQSGVVLCRAGEVAACTRRLLSSHDFVSGDGTTVERYRAKFAYVGGKLIVSDVERKGDVDSVRPWGKEEGELFLSAGEHSLAELMADPGGAS